MLVTALCVVCRRPMCAQQVLKPEGTEASSKCRGVDGPAPASCLISGYHHILQFV